MPMLRSEVGDPAPNGGLAISNNADMHMTAPSQKARRLTNGRAQRRRNNHKQFEPSDPQRSELDIATLASHQ